MRCTSNKAKWTDGQTDSGGRSKHFNYSWENPHGGSGVGVGVGGWGGRHLGVWYAVISVWLFERFHNKSRRFYQKISVFSHCSTQSPSPHGPAISLCLIRAHSGELKTHPHMPFSALHQGLLPSINPTPNPSSSFPVLILPYRSNHMLCGKVICLNRIRIN